MRNFFTKTIGRRLFWGFAVMLALIAFMGGLSVWGIQIISNTVTEKLSTSFEINDLALQISAELLEASSKEKDYQLNYHTLGFAEARLQYVDPVIAHIANVRTYLNSIAEIERQQGETVKAQAAQDLIPHLDLYESTFLDVIALYEQRGITRDGLIGKLRISVRDLDALVKRVDDTEMEILLLQVRNNEKDYLLSADPVHIAAVKSLLYQLEIKKENSRLTPEQKQNVQTLMDNYVIDLDSVVAIDNQIAAQIEMYRQSIGTIEESIAQIINESHSGVDIASESIFNQMKAVLSQVSFVGVAGVIAGLSLVWFVTRSITRPLNRVISTADIVASGDLSQRVNYASSDEIGTLSNTFNHMADQLQVMIENERQSKLRLEETVSEYNAFINVVANGELSYRLDLRDDENSDLYELGENLNEMVDSLGNMAQQIKENADIMSSAAAQILAAMTQQNASATEQDAAVSQTLVTVEELRATISQAAERAQQVAKVSQQSVEVSRSGQNAVGDSMNGMKAIQQQVESIAENILLLSEQTQQIGAIISTVTEIADQSKLLALNASIEAARAGEEGKGFGVVALEVRQMAEQSRQATVQVRDILNRIQQATNTSVMVTEQGSKGTEQGLRLIENAGLSIQELAEVILQAAQAAAQIAASTHQQINGVDQLVIAMKSIKQATTQTAASTRQAERSAMDLHGMAQQMQELAARYKLS